MGITMDLPSAQTMATSVSSRAAADASAYESLLTAIENFAAEEGLKGRAYDSAKNYCTTYIIPVLRGLISFVETLGTACQTYVSSYISDVDSKSWNEEDLIEQIAWQNSLLTDIANLSERATTSKAKASLDKQWNHISQARDTFQKILDNLYLFNGDSPNYFSEAESLFEAVAAGLSQMSSSWNSDTKTYTSPTATQDLTWQTTINTRWEKRQAIVEKPDYMTVSETKTTTVETEVAQMPWSELEQNYVAITKTRKQSTQTGYGYAVTNVDDLKRDNLIITRYEAEASQHQEEVTKVSKTFQDKIKAMSLEEIKEKYPYVNSLNPYYDSRVLFNIDQQSRAEQEYIIKRYFELEKQAPVSVRSSDFMKDYTDYINQTGKNPFDGKPVDEATDFMAEHYQTVRGASTAVASVAGAMADFSELYAGKISKTTSGSVTRERVLKNIEESRLARESSNFKGYLTNEKGVKNYLKTLEDMSPEDRRRYQQWHKYAEAGISPEDRGRVLEISEKAPKVEYIPDTYTKQDILDIKPNVDESVFRPEVEDYLDSNYIEAHRQQFENGAARFQKFQPSESWNEGIVGGDDGTSFWLSKDHADIIEEIAKGNNRLYETLLGFDEGYLGDGPLYRLDVSPEVVSEKDISIPSGNESGANEWWRPGGRTYPGDMPEGVMKGISTKEGDHTWNIVN